MLSKLTHHHAAMFLLTFVTFSLYRASKKAFSNVKDSLSKEWSPTSCNSSWPCPQPCEIWSSHNMFDNYKAAEPFLGDLDTVFLCSYAVGLYISGPLGDRFELRLVLAFGMWLSAVMVFLFGTFAQWLHFYSKPFYIAMWILNGLFQSSGWPCVVAIVGNWFGKSGRGFVFGVWSSCTSVGNIIGSLIAGSLIDYGYEFVFLYAAISLFGGGFVVFFGVINSPVDIGLEDPNSLTIDPITDAETEPCNSGQADNEHDYDETTVLLPNGQKTKPVGFLQALKLPGVITYALVNAAIKLINYSLILWLPYYFSNNFGWSDSSADDLSVWYDVGSIIGGIVFGVISDLSGKRSPVLFFMVLVTPLAIWGYQTSPANKVINGVLLCVLGAFIGGVSNIIGTTVNTDLGKQEAVGNNTDALSTVTGIIDGTGSIGAAIGQFLLTVIQSHAGWKWVFYSFMIECAFVLICLIPALARDLKTWQPLRRFRHFCNRLSARSTEY